MIHINTGPQSCKDKAEKILQQHLAGDVISLFDPSAELLLHFQLMIKEGRLAPDALAVTFYPTDGSEKQPIHFDRNGRADVWPDGFYDEQSNLIHRLL